MKDAWVYTNTTYGWVNIEETDFINIEQGLHGDNITFEYNGEQFTSNMVFGSKPG